MLANLNGTPQACRLEKDRVQVCANERQIIEAEVQRRIEEEKECKRVISKEMRRVTVARPGNPYGETENQFRIAG